MWGLAAGSDPERCCREEREVRLENSERHRREECEVRVWDSSERRLTCVWEVRRGEDEILNNVAESVTGASSRSDTETRAGGDIEVSPTTTDHGPEVDSPDLTWS